MLYTSYFSNVKNIKSRCPNMTFVSIAGKTPEWFSSMDNFFYYPAFAPKYSWWKEWHDKFKDNYESAEAKEFYVARYNSDVLACLKASKVKADLQELSNGNDICLLCYETPEKFCHRHLAAQWLESNGIDCIELVFNDDDKVPQDDIMNL